MKTLIHPGEVNKLLDVPHHSSIVVTHSDTPDVYVWNFDKQQDRSTDLASTNPDDKKPSLADVVLKGHTADAEFALGTCSASPQVASGGKDTSVLVWNLQDAASTLALSSTPGEASAITVAGSPSSTEIQPRCKLEGHYKTVEDVAFLPGSSVELCSVADDFSLLFWDTRTPAGPVARVPRAHGERDVHCCDWSALRTNCIVTGAQDGGVRLWDKRNLGGALLTINHHTEAVMNVEFSPHRPALFATGADDGLVCVWDMDAKAPEADGLAAAKKQKIAAPHQLMFQHAGHQSPVVDFCWNPVDEWTVLSASVDVGAAGGGTLQMWRMSDLIYRSEEDIMAELEPFKEFIVGGDVSKLPGANGNVAADQGTAVNGGGGGKKGEDAGDATGGGSGGDELQQTEEQTDVDMTDVVKDEIVVE